MSVNLVSKTDAVWDLPRCSCSQVPNNVLCIHKYVMIYMCMCMHIKYITTVQQFTIYFCGHHWSPNHWNNGIPLTAHNSHNSQDMDDARVRDVWPPPELMAPRPILGAMGACSAGTWDLKLHLYPEHLSLPNLKDNPTGTPLELLTWSNYVKLYHFSYFFQTWTKPGIVMLQRNAKEWLQRNDCKGMQRGHIMMYHDVSRCIHLEHCGFRCPKAPAPRWDGRTCVAVKRVRGGCATQSASVSPWEFLGPWLAKAYISMGPEKNQGSYEWWWWYIYNVVLLGTNNKVPKWD